MAGPVDDLNRALADRYAVERELASGGMATVYLAEDRKHHRKVAIKVLKPDLAATLGPERFLREIEIAAGLTHPHILPLLDSGVAEGFLYYVMPYIEGESLRTKLTREGELPVSAAVRILRDVVDALATAHRQGIVHRDIKPDNVLLLGNHAVVTDFGVAKAVSAATGAQQLTTAGVALGTPAYMAPEQAVADPHVDHRADIYAVGVMAYEMLTGRPPFTGLSAQEVLAAHVTKAPEPVTVGRDTVPPALAETVMRSLAKKPADRWQNAEELLHVLEALATPAGGREASKVAAALRSAVSLRTVALAGMALIAIFAIWAVARFGRSPQGSNAPGTVLRTTRLSTEQGMVFDPALSPDGRFLAYAGGDMRGPTNIYVRRIGEAGALNLTQNLPVANNRWPRWSPDGAWIAYERAGQIHVISALGGAQRQLTEGSFPAWSPDGRRLAFVRGDTLFALALDALTPEVLTTAWAPHSPAWSSDGSRIVYVVGNPIYRGTNNAPSALSVLNLATRVAIALTDTQHVNQSPAWTHDGQAILFVSDRDGSADIYQLALDRSGVPRGSPVRLTVGASVHLISATPSGRLVAYSTLSTSTDLWRFALGPGSGPLHLSDGRRIMRGIGGFFDISLDGRWLAFEEQGGRTTSKMDLESRAVVRLAEGGMVPSWSRDGREIAYYEFREGSRDIFVMSADGRNRLALTHSVAQERAPSWSPDGRSLVFSSEQGGSYRLQVLSRPGPTASSWEAAPREVSAHGGWAPRWSPDGKLIAFVRGEAQMGMPVGGLVEIVTVTADGAGERVLATTRVNQSSLPNWVAWSSDGRSVLYMAADEKGTVGLWAVPVVGGAPRRLISFDRELQLTQCFRLHGDTLYVGAREAQAGISLLELSKVQ